MAQVANFIYDRAPDSYRFPFSSYFPFSLSGMVILKFSCYVYKGVYSLVKLAVPSRSQKKRWKFGPDFGGDGG